MNNLYLAGNIAGCSNEEVHEWREYAKSSLPGFSFRDPTDRDYRETELTPNIVKAIVEEDKKDIDESNFVLANCLRPGVGTSMEVLYAFERHKVVVVVSPDPSPWLVYHANYITHDLDNAIEWILNYRKDEALSEENKAYWLSLIRRIV